MSGQFILKPGGKLGILSGFIGEGKVALKGQSHCQPCCDPCESFPAASDHFSEHFNGLDPGWSVVNGFGGGSSFGALTYPGTLFAEIQSDISIPSNPYCIANWSRDSSVRKQFPTFNLMRMGATFVGGSFSGSAPLNSFQLILSLGDPAFLFSLALTKTANGNWPRFVATTPAGNLHFFDNGMTASNIVFECVWRRITATDWRGELWVNGLLRAFSADVATLDEQLEAYACVGEPNFVLAWQQTADYWVKYDDVFCEIESS